MKAVFGLICSISMLATISAGSIKAAYDMDKIPCSEEERLKENTPESTPENTPEDIVEKDNIIETKKILSIKISEGEMVYGKKENCFYKFINNEFVEYKSINGEIKDKLREIGVDLSITANYQINDHQIISVNNSNGLDEGTISYLTFNNYLGEFDHILTNAEMLDSCISQNIDTTYRCWFKYNGVLYQGFTSGNVVTNSETAISGELNIDEGLYHIYSDYYYDYSDNESISYFEKLDTIEMPDVNAIYKLTVPTIDLYYLPANSTTIDNLKYYGKIPTLMSSSCYDIIESGDDSYNAIYNGFWTDHNNYLKLYNDDYDYVLETGFDCANDGDYYGVSTIDDLNSDASDYLNREDIYFFTADFGDNQEAVTFGYYKYNKISEGYYIAVPLLNYTE